MSAKYATFGGPPPGKSARVSEPLHPYAAASWPARALLTWVNPLMALGNKKQLDENDVWPLQRHHQSAVVVVPFAREFASSNSVVKAFLACFGWRFLFTGVGFLVATATTLAGPVVLNHVVSELSAGDYDVQDLTKWIFALLATQLLQAFADNYASFDSEVMAIQFSGALKNLIYDKTLKLSAESRKKKSAGEITNLYTTDCDMIPAIAYAVHQLWIMPLQIVTVSVFLYRLIGPASLAGVGVIVFTFVVNQFVAFQIYALYMAIMKAKDARLRTVTEAFKAISIAKFNAWEDNFITRIGEARANEVDKIWKFLKFNAISVVAMWGLPVFISAASFTVYTHVMHQQLTPAIVFTSIALFQLIAFPLRIFPAIIGAMAQGKGSLDRIQEFLSFSELATDTVLSIESPEANGFISTNVIVALENATLGWGEDSSPAIRNANLHVNVGEFVVVHGPVGCGKSSLCSALIGDMVKTQGLVYVGGSVAYCSQQPWIQHATVRDNILFGRPFDRKKYDKVIEACALTADLKSLPAGDRTEIGERGVNLSGGQKARVALARACYSDASVYILDAPLSAVDAIVQNEIFTKCLLGLLRHRTVILVTHNAEIIASEHVTRAVTISEYGSVIETRATGGGRPAYASAVTPLAARAYAKNVKTFEEAPLHVDSHAHQHEVQELTEMSVGLKSPMLSSVVASTFDEDDSTHQHHASTTTDETHRLVDDEDRKEGRVGFLVFKAYYNAVGGFRILAIVLLSQVLWQGFQISSDFWVSDWSTDATAKPEDVVSESYRIQVYTLLGLTSALMVVVRTWTVSYVGLRAARNMFNRMTDSLMHAPMKFFDANPIGRIMTRYTEDTTSVDISVPLSFGGFFANLFSVGCSMLTTAVIIQWKGIALIPIIAVYAYVGHVYLQPAREIERLMRTNEAPILSFLAECIEGSSSIRAYGPKQVHRFHLTNNGKLDTSNKVWYARLAITRWFGLRMQLLGTVLVFAVAFSLMLLHNELSAAIIGLAFSYILKVSVSMEQIIQAWSNVETNMVSPERLQEFIDIEQEAPHKIAVADPPKSDGWPSKAAIRFDHVDFRYKTTDRLVLKNLNFSISSGEKVGIVGRTGAGKSSLTMALFRINELAGGTVSIDGVDVGKIGLKTLREKMSIIPQNPVLFRDSIRKNLDPFDEYTDDQLWECIRRVGLNERIASEEDKLGYAVEENGENFSVGERQMLCMARALLRDSRIVIFDEATAAIDHETDKKLQRVIREAFDKSTVLTIAHRLDTILDSDRILVLDGGEVVEFASPAELVKKGKGHFFDLMQEGGYLDKFLASNK